MKAVISEIFVSLQGEGQSVGCPVLFVRFVGCNRKCRWCDEARTQHPINTDKAEYLYSPKELVSHISSTYPIILPVTFTGGEPMLQRVFMHEVIHSLSDERDFYLETNGDFLDEVFFSFFRGVTVSPKLASSGLSYHNYANLSRINEVCDNIHLKFVIGSAEDYREMRDAVCAFNLGSLNPIWLQPADGVFTFQQLWEEWNAMPTRNTRLLPQMHKLLGMR